MLSFDDACARFTKACSAASQWKHNYFGAAYSTRLRQAVADLKIEISLLEAVLDDDYEKCRKTLAALVNGGPAADPTV